MAFDGIITNSIIKELNSSILDGKINKIFQPNKNEILLGIYSNKHNYALNICIDSNNYRLHLTTFSKPNPQNAPNFCMLLRKHILGYRIKKIETFGLERIVSIILEGYNELNDLTTKKLIIELMGKHSNIILLNSNNFIIDSLRHLDIYSNSNRDILPAHSYVLPQNTKKNFLKITTFDEFKNSLIDLQPINKAIVDTYTGFSYSFVNLILDKLQIDKTALTNQLTILNLQNIYHYISTILNEDFMNSSIVEFTNEKNKTDYSLILQEKKEKLSNNFFIDDFYYKKETQDIFVSYRNNILKLVLNVLSKYSNRIKNIDLKLDECKNKDLYKLYGELITANLYQFKNQSLTNISVPNYYNNNEIITIPLEKKYSVYTNASRYFKKYNKLKNALEIVTIQKKDAIKDINYIESIIYELESSKTLTDIKEIYIELSTNPIFSEYLNNKKESSKKNTESSLSSPRQYTIDGFTVLVGKNNVQNDYLTTKLANKNDIWFHTKDIHGSHVILKNTNTDEITDDILVKCAEIAAFYSKAKFSSNVPVDYCFVRYVKKVSGSKPGMVIYTNNKTINVKPKEPNC